MPAQDRMSANPGKSVYSLWLTFAKPDQYWLHDWIKTLAEEYQAPAFIPHLTIYGSVPIGFRELVRISRHSTAGMVPFQVVTGGRGHSDYIWKTAFLKVNLIPEIGDLYRRLKSALGGAAAYVLKPHISLIYKHLPVSERVRILDLVPDREHFLVDSLSVVETGPTVAKWRVLRRFVFQAQED